MLFLHVGFLACVFLNEKHQDSVDYGTAVIDDIDSVLCLSKSDLRNWGINKVYSVSQYQVSGWRDYPEWQVDEYSFEENRVSLYTASYYWDSSFVFQIDSFGTGAAAIGATFLNNFNEEGKLISSGGHGYGAFDWRAFFWVNDTMAVVETTCSGHCGGNIEPQHSIRHYNADGLLEYEVYVSIGNLHEEEGEEYFFKDYQTFKRELDSLPEDEVRYDTTFYEYGKSICQAWYVSSLPNKRSEEYYSKFKFHQIFIGKESMESFIFEKTGRLPKLIFMQVNASESYSFIFNEKVGQYF